MKPKSESSINLTKDEKNDTVEIFDNNKCAFRLQVQRIMKILTDTIFKLKVLTALPTLMDNNGEVLRQHLNETDSDLIVLVCQDTLFSKQMMEERPDLLYISNMLDKVNINEKRGSIKKNRNPERADSYEIHVAYIVDVIFKTKSLVEYMFALSEEMEQENLVKEFFEAMERFKDIVFEKLNLSASDKIKREVDLKTAYRSSMLLSDNIAELEEQLEKQRQELEDEFDRKQIIVENLSEKIAALKEKSQKETSNIVYDSEVMMQKDWNKSQERQEELAEKAQESVDQYEALLRDHLDQEKVLRSKKAKIDGQVASWVAKYDLDMGEKFSELDALDQSFKEEQNKYNELLEQFNEQEKEYVALMAEKEEEERQINEEKMWRFLQNFAARKIQRYWRAYRARKLARKRGRKGKKKGSADKKKKGKKSPKDDGEKLTLKGGPDPNALIESKFKGDLLKDIENKDAWTKEEVKVDLN